MCILPFFHSFGLVAMNFGVAQGGKLVMLPRFDLDMALKQLAKERPIVLPGRAPALHRAERGTRTSPSTTCVR